jgi:hypothetical protein
LRQKEKKTKNKNPQKKKDAPSITPSEEEGLGLIRLPQVPLNL